MDKIGEVVNVVESYASSLSDLALLIISLLICFAGFKLSKMCLGLGGFCLGMVIVRRIIGLIGVADDTLSIVLTYVAAALIGIALAGIAYRFLKAGAFLLAAFAGYMLASSLVFIPVVATVLVAIICGALALIFFRTAVIIASSVAGGMTAAPILMGMFPVLSEIPFGNLILGVLLTLAGMLLQFSMKRKKKS